MALSAWEYLPLSGSSLEENSDGVGGSLSGPVLTGGVLLAAIFVWLLSLAALFGAPVSRHLSNTLRLAVGRPGATVLALVVVAALATVFWGLVVLRVAVAWFTVLTGPASQAYFIVLLQRSAMVVLRGVSTSES